MLEAMQVQSPLVMLQEQVLITTTSLMFLET